MPTTSRRAVIGAAAWTTPVVLVGTAAPAFAASAGQVVSTFDVQRSGTDVLESGVITNNGTADVVVTIRISCDLALGTSAAITGGALANEAGWAMTYFNWTDGTGSDPTSAYYEATTVAPLAPGASMATPDVSFFIDQPDATGTARLTVSVPPPATAQQPDPQPIPAFAGAGARSASPPREGFPAAG